MIAEPIRTALTLSLGEVETIERHRTSGEKPGHIWPRILGFLTPRLWFLPRFAGEKYIAWDSHSTPVCWGCQ